MLPMALPLVCNYFQNVIHIASKVRNNLLLKSALQAWKDIHLKFGQKLLNYEFKADIL